MTRRNIVAWRVRPRTFSPVSLSAHPVTGQAHTLVAATGSSFILFIRRAQAKQIKMYKNEKENAEEIPGPLIFIYLRKSLRHREIPARCGVLHIAFNHFMIEKLSLFFFNG